MLFAEARHNHHKGHRREPRVNHHPRNVGFGIALTLVMAGGVAAVVASSSSSRDSRPAAVIPREKNVAYDQATTMNVPIVATPGTAFGTASAGGVSVTGANIALGHVRLGVLVAPAWTIRNTSAHAVTLGSPHAEVRKGCCPGALGFDNNATTVAPGASTTLRFGLTMHPGMDGPHDFTVHVPVGQAQLTLGVTGDFSD
jgi:hypothetical protein